ncbi:unnamed protein product [Choristocarpus tenellus]
MTSMRLVGVEPDVASYTAAMGACARGGDLEAALNLLEDMRTGKGPVPDQYAYAQAAVACATGLDHARALSILEGMREDGVVVPQEPMYGAVINACARSGKWRDAEELLWVRGHIL